MIANVRRFVLLLAVSTPALLFAPALAPAPAHAASHAITMANYAFSPRNETITAGDSVTWTNTDQAPHDVTTTSAPVSIHSATLTTGQSWTYTFTVPGTYSYLCSIHPDMTATLVVRPAAVAATTQAVAPPVAPAHRGSVTTERVVPQTVPATSAPAAAAPAAAPATTSADPEMDMGAQAAQPATASAAPSQSGPSLNPLLLVAGLVAAVATLCLLLIGSTPESGS
jgi:plastocyanin